MKTRGLLIVSLVIAAARIVFAFLTASLLPEGALLPSHFGADGQPDRYSAALPALLVQQGILTLVFAAFYRHPAHRTAAWR